jgi:divalent metal cation (Fe/Co/Zn/Cd) transporter
VGNLHKRALVLSWVTVGYNILEGVVSIAAGALAGSIALVGFGLDSFVESLSGLIMVWRFTGAHALSAEDEERRERRAAKLVGWTFFILGAYVAFESARKLWTGERPEPSLLGIAIAIISLVTMPTLWWLKVRTAKALGSRSFAADAKQTMACTLLSAALLLGLGLNAWAGLWQADPAIGIVIAIFLFREGYETLHEEKLCSCCGPVELDKEKEEPYEKE